MACSNATIQTAGGIHLLGDTDRVLMHEHIFNRYPYSRQREMEEFVLRELNAAHKQGITVICDLTAYTKPYNYYNVIENSPVKIVSCVGFYTSRYIPEQVKRQGHDSLIRTYGRMIEKGVGSRRIKPGILKIAAQSHILSPLEKKLFSVVAHLSREYGLPIALHAPKGTLSHVCSLISEGANPNKIFAAHIESGITIESEFEKRITEAAQIMKLGSYIQLSDFGCTVSSVKREAGLRFIEELIRNGYLSHLLLSGDSCWRWKNDKFVVKEYNHCNGKHYTYTIDSTISMIKEKLCFADIDSVLLLENPGHLFST